MTTRVLRTVSVTLVALFGLGAAAFIVGEIVTDPGGMKAALMIAAWGVPMIALILVALIWPDLGTKVLAVALVLVGGLSVIDAFAHIIDRDTWGPVDTIAMYAVAIPCGLLGARKAAAAGWLLLAGSGLQLLVSIGRFAPEEGHSAGSALGGSAGALVMPLMLAGLLFLATAASESAQPGEPRAPKQKIRHAH